MTLESFASAELMQQRSQGAISSATHPYLGRELAAASSAIRDFCGWHVWSVEELTYRRGGPSWRSVWLPAMEIASVASVKVDGTVWEAEALALVEFDPDTGWTNISGRVVEVTFSAGYESVPATLEALTLQVAARALGSPLGIVREQAGTVSVTYSQPASNIAGGDVLLPHEQDMLAPYKLELIP